MTQEESAQGRLRFAELVPKAFAFLLRIGLIVVRREATLVRFESDAVFVNIYHGRASYQIGVEIGRLNSQEKYSLHELLMAFAPDEVDKARYQTGKADLLKQYLTELASTIDAKCRDVLVGDADAFEVLERVTSVSRQAATLQAEYGAIVDQADKAWEDKNLDRAATLYEASQPALDKTRRRRLEYLRERRSADD